MVSLKHYRKRALWGSIVALCLILSALFMFAGTEQPSQASSVVASPWVKTRSANFRLAAGFVPEMLNKSQVRWAALEIDLFSGGKTYWRSPGEAGVPPSLDWSKSKNLKEAKLFWPSPHRFKEADSTAIGYKGRVLLPIQITAKDPSQPVKLDLAMFLGICTEICIPIQQKLTLTLPAGHVQSLDLGSVMKAVPTVLDSKQAGAYLKGIKIIQDGKKSHLEVVVSFPKGSADQDLLLEAPEDFYIPLPRLLRRTLSADGENQHHVYGIDLADVEKPETLIGQPLRLTLLSDKGAFDIATTVK